MKKVNIKQTPNRPDGTLALFLKSLPELYPDDRTTPGCTVAYLPDRGVFYASLCRYEGYAARDKIVVLKATGNTPLEALQSLAENWVRSMNPHEPTNFRKLVADCQRRVAA